MVVARFLNWPETLERLTYPDNKGIVTDPQKILSIIEDIAAAGHKVWGNAYVVTTHGLPMGKAQYLCRNVLPAAYDLLGAARWRGAYTGSTRTLACRYDDYITLEGMGSFMAAQVLADLKNTPGHPLYTAEDWSMWSAPGPGSLRGLAWYYGRKIKLSEYETAILEVRDQLPGKAATLLVTDGKFNMQDLQNCLCEFDKYCRVRSGTGRSKRGYPGK